MAFLDRFRKHGGLLCPRCEEALDTHDEEKCRRRMTRRHFVGMWGAAVAIAYGGGQVMLATESHVKAIEKEFGKRAWMVSHKNGLISTSLIDHDAPLGPLSTVSFNRKFVAGQIDTSVRVLQPRDTAVGVLKLRSLGYHVHITGDVRKHYEEANRVSRGILAGRVPDTDPNSEFPSVYRW